MNRLDLPEKFGDAFKELSQKLLTNPSRLSLQDAKNNVKEYINRVANDEMLEKYKNEQKASNPNYSITKIYL